MAKEVSSEARFRWPRSKRGGVRQAIGESTAILSGEPMGFCVEGEVTSDDTSAVPRVEMS